MSTQERRRSRLPAHEWAAFSPARRGFEAVAMPIFWGVVCGLLLAWSAPAYLVGSAIGILGGIGAGAQHATLRGALVRGLVGGTQFGLAILLGLELTGENEATVELPDPAILLLVLTVVPAFPLHALGWRLARRRAA
jgi:hypothetical protein